MNSSAPTSRAPSITARPSPAEKQRFAELAAARGISESALALIAIRALLDPAGARNGQVTPESARQPAAHD